MKESLVPIPNLSNFEKLENSEGIKSFNELGIVQIPYEKKFTGGEKVGKLQLEKFLNESGQTYAKDISSPLKAPASCSRLSSYITYGNLSIKYIVKKKHSKNRWSYEKKKPEMVGLDLCLPFHHD